MTKGLCICFLLISIFSFGQSEIETQKFSPDALKQDVSYLFSRLENIHPSLYHYTSRNKIDSMRNALERDLSQPITRLEFARKLIPVVAMLKEGHTSLAFPQEEFETYLKNGGLTFPFSVLVRDHRIFVTVNYSNDSSIPAFSEIRSINGVATSNLLNQMREYVSAELDFYRDIQVQKSFRRLLWYLMRFEETYELELVDNGSIMKKTVSGITNEDLKIKVQQKDPAASKDYSFKVLGNTLGVINFRSMKNLDGFKKFLDSTFNVIQNNKIEHLVIDVRGNGGGDSKLGEALFNYITSKPYKQAESAEIKTEGGGIKTVTVTKSIKPKRKRNAFTGKTYLLIDHLTFSSANMLANAYKCYSMGIVIGEETGGVLIAFGDLIYFTLPNTKLQAACSHKKFVHPCADGLMHGVQPDIEIVPTQEDIKTGKDGAMEYVKELVAKANQK